MVHSGVLLFAVVMLKRTFLFLTLSPVQSRVAVSVPLINHCLPRTEQHHLRV